MPQYTLRRLAERRIIRVSLPGGTAEEFIKAATEHFRGEFFVPTDRPVVGTTVYVEAPFAGGSVAVRGEAMARAGVRDGKQGIVLRLVKLDADSLQIPLTPPLKSLSDRTPPTSATPATPATRPTPQPDGDEDDEPRTVMAPIPAAVMLAATPASKATTRPPPTPAKGVPARVLTKNVVRRTAPIPVVSPSMEDVPEDEFASVSTKASELSADLARALQPGALAGVPGARNDKPTAPNPKSKAAASTAAAPVAAVAPVAPVRATPAAPTSSSDDDDLAFDAAFQPFLEEDAPASSASPAAATPSPAPPPAPSSPPPAARPEPVKASALAHDPFRPSVSRTATANVFKRESLVKPTFPTKPAPPRGMGVRSSAEHEDPEIEMMPAMETGPTNVRAHVAAGSEPITARVAPLAPPAPIDTSSEPIAVPEPEPERAPQPDSKPTHSAQTRTLDDLIAVDGEPDAPSIRPTRAPSETPAPVPEAAPTKRRSRGPVLAILGAIAVAAVVVLIILARRDQATPDATPPPAVVAKPDATAVEVKNHLQTAASRVTEGKLVGPGGDTALDHLLLAKRVAPDDPEVIRNLAALANTFEQLGDGAIAADDLAEAAAHLQAALTAEPGRESAAKKLQDVEARVRERQKKRPAP